MASREGFQEVVMLFDSAGARLEAEMRLGQFNSLLAQKGTLDGHVAGNVKAVYAQVGPGLAVSAAVFFLFKVSEDGYIDPSFNLPLEYMAQNAGEGPDLGDGPINMACRSQCPVPWHAINMWEPAGQGNSHPATLVQQAVRRNRLGLKPVPVTRGADGKPIGRAAACVEAVGRILQNDRAVDGQARSVSADGGSQRHGAPKAKAKTPPAVPEKVGRSRKAKPQRPASRPVSRSAAVPVGPPARAVARPARQLAAHSVAQPAVQPAAQPVAQPVAQPDPEPLDQAVQEYAQAQARARLQSMEEKLTATFGEAGRVSVDQYARQHREHLGQVAAQFRAEMERQQRGYLEQIKSCRDEIQQLKASLRHEQKRNQRLQELLRG